MVDTAPQDSLGSTRKQCTKTIATRTVIIFAYSQKLHRLWFYIPTWSTRNVCSYNWPELANASLCRRWPPSQQGYKPCEQSKTNNYMVNKVLIYLTIFDKELCIKDINSRILCKICCTPPWNLQYLVKSILCKFTLNLNLYFYKYNLQRIKIHIIKNQTSSQPKWLS